MADDPRLAEMRAREQAATRGPWRAGKSGNNNVYGPDGDYDASGAVAAVFKGPANREFIAHAREDIPYLLDLVQQQAEALQQIPTWQPIETAPKDTDVVAFFPDTRDGYNVMIVHQFADDPGAWYQQDADLCPDALDVEPTHWQPLPDPPASLVSPTQEKGPSQ